MRSIDGREHDVAIYFDATGELVVVDGHFGFRVGTTSRPGIDEVESRAAAEVREQDVADVLQDDDGTGGPPAPEAEPRLGNCLPLSKIPLGMEIHNIEMNPGQGGKMVRNPFTGEMVRQKAKPASRTVRVRPLKSIKDRL